VDSNLATHETALVFRPAKLATRADVEFSGNQPIDTETLKKAVFSRAKGSGYTDYDFRQLLQETVRPLYLDRGYLQVTFPSLSTRETPGGLVVKSVVAEGGVYTLGKVEVNGASGGHAVSDQFETGKPANWGKVEQVVERLLQGLRNTGYLQAASKIEPRFNESTRVANLVVTLEKGPVFAFGKLILKGLAAPLEPRVRALWTLPEGAPLNEEYANEFVTTAFQKGGLGPEYNGVAHQLNIRPDTRVVDVEITFRR
jgi:outer membrane protein assembly factor BamA